MESVPLAPMSVRVLFILVRHALDHPEEFLDRAEIRMRANGGGSVERFAVDQINLIKSKLGDIFLNRHLLGYRLRWRPIRNEYVSPPTPPPRPRDYLDWVMEECGRIVDPLSSVAGESRPQLKDIYVPLAIPGKDPGSLDPLLSLLGRGSLIVSGLAGCGKSTFCKWVAWLTANGGMPNQPAAQLPDDFREEFPTSFAGRLPILFRLRELSGFPTNPDAAIMKRDDFESLLEAAWRAPGLKWADAKTYLEAGKALLILDGVDEIPLRHRSSVLLGMADAVRHWKGKGNRILITSRPFVLSIELVNRFGLKNVEIPWLSPKLQELLVQRVFRALGQPDTRAQELLAAIPSREAANELAQNPNMLTAMCVIYHRGRRLPEARYDLYKLIVKTVLSLKFNEQNAADIRNQLEHVAYAMHTGRGLDNERYERTTPNFRVTNAEISRVLTPYLEASPSTQQGFVRVEDAVQKLLSRSGLLKPAGDDGAEFYHTSIQDFLAVQLLDKQVGTGKALLQFFRAKGRHSEWRTALGFAFGKLLTDYSDASLAKTFLQELILTTEFSELKVWVVVGDCLRILLGKKRPGSEDKERVSEEAAQRFRNCVHDAIEREASLQERFALGIALGYVGDDRILDLRNDAAYIPVPADKYLVGEKKRKFRLVQDIRVARFPVTNSQYEMFMNDGGYDREDLWSPEGWAWKKENCITMPAYWNGSPWNGPNQPVVGVSFYEAEACARWAGGRLPTEWEWEAAARGPGGRTYPWGEEYRPGICNTSDAKLNSTSPVGLFKSSRQADFGIEDLSGNVWEWCASKYEEGSVRRVVRGGSWFVGSGVVRAAFRDRSNPVRRIVNLGFRVIR